MLADRLSTCAYNRDALPETNPRPPVCDPIMLEAAYESSIRDVEFAYCDSAAYAAIGAAKRDKARALVKAIDARPGFDRLGFSFTS